MAVQEFWMRFLGHQCDNEVRVGFQSVEFALAVSEGLSAQKLQQIEVSRLHEASNTVEICADEACSPRATDLNNSLAAILADYPHSRYVIDLLHSPAAASSAESIGVLLCCSDIYSSEFRCLGRAQASTHVIDQLEGLVSLAALLRSQFTVRAFPDRLFPPGPSSDSDQEHQLLR